MKQNVKIYPEQNVLYNQQKKMKPKPDPFPNPPVVSLLPLRPKTCMPRKQQALETPRESLQIEDALKAVTKVLRTGYFFITKQVYLDLILKYRYMLS